MEFPPEWDRWEWNLPELLVLPELLEFPQVYH
jgi:hypothetical protein